MTVKLCWFPWFLFVCFSHPWAKTLANIFRVLIDKYWQQNRYQPNPTQPSQIVGNALFYFGLVYQMGACFVGQIFLLNKKTCFQGKVVRKIIFRVPHLSKHQLTLFLPKNKKTTPKNISAFLKSATKKG